MVKFERPSGKVVKGPPYGFCKIFRKFSDKKFSSRMNVDALKRVLNMSLWQVKFLPEVDRLLLGVGFY